MESASAPRSRSIAVMAVISVALLLVGFGAGYLLARPAAPTEPGAVDGLNRPSQVPRVQGWYKGQDVAYLDYGPMTNVAEPILVFFQSDGTPVSGQRNVIDVIPGDGGYSDLWQVVKVVVDSAYTPNSLRDASDILAQATAGGVTLEVAGIYVNCPVVP